MLSPTGGSMRPRSLLVALVLVTTACTRAIVQNVPVQDVVGPANKPTDLTITTKDGILNLWSATIVGDTVVGYSRRGDDIRRVRQAVARTDVQTVSIRKTDPFLTAALLVAAGAAGFVLLMASMFSGGSTFGQ
jgi:hypothetical protein